MNLPFSKAIRVFWRSFKSYVSKKPITLCFEVTNSCNLNCRHCNWGGMIEEKFIPPEEYTKLCKIFNPPSVHISGGEPLVRKDVVEIAKAIKSASNDGMPYLIFVSNASLMTEEKYLELVNAGVDQFSFSLDFPDERHDDFRRRPGLYAHLEKLIPKLTSFGYDNIILNTAITSKNFRHMIDLTKKAEEWNTYISFSAYTLKRTWNEAYAFTNEDDLNALEKAINELIEYKRKGGHIATAESTIRKTLEYFKRGGHMPNCRAGSRFVIVLPNGSLLPCTYFREKEFSEHKQILKEFTANNKCDDCFVSVRAFSDKSVCDLLFSSIDSYRAILAKHKDSRRNK